MLGPHNVNVLSAPRPSDALKICVEETVDVLISDVSTCRRWTGISWRSGC